MESRMIAFHSVSLPIQDSANSKQDLVLQTLIKFKSSDTEFVSENIWIWFRRESIWIEPRPCIASCLSKNLMSYEQNRSSTARISTTDCHRSSLRAYLGDSLSHVLHDSLRGRRIWKRNINPQSSCCPIQSSWKLSDPRAFDVLSCDQVAIKRLTYTTLQSESGNKDPFAAWYGLTVCNCSAAYHLFPFPYTKRLVIWQQEVWPKAQISFSIWSVCRELQNMSHCQEGKQINAQMIFCNI